MLWKTDDNSTASTLCCSLTQSLKGSVATLGHSNKTRPWGQQRAAGSRGVSEMVRAPSCPEPAGHMCFMPFSKSAAHQRVVKWFIPLQRGGVTAKPQTPLGVLEGEVSGRCRCFPSQAGSTAFPRRTGGPQGIFLFKHLSESVNSPACRPWGVRGQNDSCEAEK